MSLPWMFPLAKTVGITAESESYSRIDLQAHTEIPLPPHPGSFGFQRKYHTHEGVDLYALEGDPVYAVEDGIIVAVIPFTGPQLGSPWWHDTWQTLVQGASGVVGYGEIVPVDKVGSAGRHVVKGEILGHVKQVLTKDKGRPMCMLHLELYSSGTTTCVEWKPGEGQPSQLRNPTEHLISAQPNLLAHVQS